MLSLWLGKGKVPYSVRSVGRVLISLASSPALSPQMVIFPVIWHHCPVTGTKFYGSVTEAACV